MLLQLQLSHHVVIRNEAMHVVSPAGREFEIRADLELAPSFGLIRSQKALEMGVVTPLGLYFERPRDEIQRKLGKMNFPPHEGADS